jgi:oxygen-independent coproporphyrinogen-3 oxidase
MNPKPHHGKTLDEEEANDSSPWLVPRAAYVHIPFCAHHCGYCDFAVVEGREDQIDRYLNALQLELQRLGFPRPIDTLFLGGGTPSHLNEAQLGRLFAALDRWLPRHERSEVSLEANPDSFDNAKAELLRHLGVTRISLGVQSFQPLVLRVLERRHHPQHVFSAAEAAHRVGLRLSLDLIFGVPGQSLANWREDLRRAIDLQPEQISTYGLTWEKGTRLWKQQQRRELIPLTEESERAMYEAAMDDLETAGYSQYEISSFARPGGRCQHNQVYWANEAFFGFGMGAAAYVGGTRTLNVRQLDEYLRRRESGRSPVFQTETLGPEERARETLTLNLRRVEGVERTRFRRQTGFDVDTLAGPALARHVRAGLMIDDGGRIALTRAGRCVADSIVTDLL